MEVEKTIAFVLAMQAQTSVKLDALAERQTKAEQRMDRHEARMDRADARMDRFERGLNGIRKLIQTGMKLVVENQQAIKELSIAQKQTDRRLNAFIASREKGRNGRDRR